MKIIQILPNMNVGGVERGVLDLVSFFKHTSIENIVISNGGRLIQNLEKNNIGHIKLPVHKKSLFSLLLIPKIKTILNSENIDIIHARSRVPAWISFFASRKTNTIFLTTAHGIYKNKFWSQVMGWGKFVICPSKVVARHMKDNFGIPEEKIIIINRWVDLNKFIFSDYQRRERSNTIVSIGRISPSKGYEYLIEGFRKIVRINPLLKLQIVGSPDKSKIKYFEYLRSLVNRFSLNHNIQFTGFRQDIENILNAARILVAPSVIEESFGRVIIEAMASGVPVIATKVGGFSEIITDGKDGILIDTHDRQAITDNILKIMNDSIFTKNLIKNGYEKVQKFYTMEKCLNETADVYKQAVSFLRILVIKISSLGDLILSFPSLKALKDYFPHSKISILTLKKYSSILYDCPFLDEIITVDDNYKKWNNILSLSGALRKKSFDYIIDFQNTCASHIISFLSFPRDSFGYALRGGFLLTKKIKYLRSDGPFTSQEKVLKLLGINFDDKKLIFWNQKDTAKISLPVDKLIGINICASPRWESKNWPLNNIIGLIELVHKNLPDYKIILMGDVHSKKTAEKIENTSAPRPINLCGKTMLTDLPQILKKLNIFITGDTATMHLAAALEIPTIALFGPTDPARHIVESKNLYVLNKPIDCSFCYNPQCKLKEKNACLKKITPNEVFKKIETIL